MQDMVPSPSSTESPASAERVQEIRNRLPGQQLCLRVETAQALYGPLYSLPEIRKRIGASLPHRVGFLRSASFEPVEAYGQWIPDAALLKYDDAVRSGLFSQFLVGTPTYLAQAQTDPWIIAEVDGTEQWAVITRWD